jgi:magnesium chelatase family protein
MIVGRGWIISPTRLIEAGDNLVQAARRAIQDQLNLSARGYHRVRKLMGIIVDLSGSSQIQAVHLVGALQYCPLLKMGNFILRVYILSIITAEISKNSDVK